MLARVIQSETSAQNISGSERVMRSTCNGTLSRNGLARIKSGHYWSLGAQRGICGHKSN